MAEVSLGKLAVQIGGDTSGLDKSMEHVDAVLRSGVSKASQAAKSFLSAWGTVGGLVSAAMAAGALALKAYSDHVAEVARAHDTAANTASNLGVAIEDFSRLGYAVRSVGGSTADATGALKAMVKAASESGDEMAPSTRALAALGVEIGDVTKDSGAAQRALLEISDKFANMEDGVNKTKIAQALFNDQAEAQIPILNQGSAAMQAKFEMADKLGATMSDNLSPASKLLKESLAQVNENGSLLARLLGEALVPWMARTAQSMAYWSNELQIATRVATVFRGALAAIHTAFSALALPLKLVLETFKTIAEAMVAAASGDMRKAFDVLTGHTERVKAVFSDFGTTVVDNINYVVPGLIESRKGIENWAVTVEQAGKRTGRSLAPVMESVEQIRERNERLAAAHRLALVELQRDTSIPLTEKLAQLQVMLDNGQIKLHQYNMAVLAAREQASQLEASWHAMQMQDLMNSKLPMTEKMEQLEAAVRSGKIQFRDFLAMSKQVSDEGAAQMNDLASATSSALTSIFQENKAAAIAAAIINTAQAVMKTYAQYGATPMGFAMAGMAAAVGLAQIQRIRSTSKSSSGGGGVLATAGASAASSTASAAAPVAPAESTLFVRGIRRDELFTGEQMRALAKHMLDFQRDGGRVILGAT